MRITENEILLEIQKVLNENRKVIKLPNQAPAQPAMPQMPQEPLQQGAIPTDGGIDAGAEPDMGNMDNMSGDANEFDTNFDAGVEADEDSDPKHYIQQLTGKLSQSINSYNTDNGGDAGLCKYVASMIIAATCKNLDDKQKKELIEKIKSAQGGDDEMDDSMDDDFDGENEEMPADDSMEQEQMPLNERIITKKELMELTAPYMNDDNNILKIEKQNKCPKAWRSKFN